MMKKTIAAILILIGFLVTLDVYADHHEITITKKFVVEDIRQLAKMLVSAHPDPYSHGGGKIQFYRRLHRLINEVPEEGLTPKALWRYLLPFIASVGDCHTSLYFKKAVQPGLPLVFDVVGQELMVSGVANKALLPLVGSKISSVEKLSFEKLLKRQEELWGWKTPYDNLNHLKQFLFKKDRLKLLIPEWDVDEPIETEFTLADGTKKAHRFDLKKNQKLRWFFPPSDLPDLKTDLGDFATGFFDSKKKKAWIKIDRMMVYREHFESATKERDDLKQYIYACYKRFNNADPSSLKEAIAGIPSAVEVFRKLMIEMRDAKTESLIVDLTHNTGGDALMASILTYYLYGKDRVIASHKNAYDITKYSDLYFANHSNPVSLDKENKNRVTPSLGTDYNFAEEDKYHTGRFSEQESMEEIGISSSETFKKEWTEGTYSGFYRPKNVVVISSTETYCAGFELLVALSRNDAVVVGTHPGQAGNHFEEKLHFELNHSRIGCGVSSKIFIMFPDDSEKGKILEPDYPITYKDMKKYKFDPHARILFALDLLKKKKPLKKNN